MSTTNEQRAVEAMGCEREGDECVTHFHRWEFCDWSRCARALAAAVTAEREKYLRVADELEQFATETRDQAPAESGLLRANTVGWSGASGAAARRIREVSR